MKRAQSVDFTGKREKKRSVTIIILIIAALAMVGVLSLFILLAVNDFNIQRFLGVREETDTTTEVSTEATDETKVYSPAFADKSSVNILVVCYDDERNVTFCDVICMSAPENAIRVKPVSTQLNLNYKNGTYTVTELFDLFSAGALCEALEERNISIDRYISMTETGFKMIMQKFGAVNIELDEDVSYSEDAITYSFSAGVQEFTSDALLKYMKYAADGDELLTVQAQAIVQILKTYFTAETAKMDEDTFSELINLVDSNISAFDFTEKKDKIVEFLSANPTISPIS